MSDSPAALPLRFFSALNNRDYVGVWNSLTQRSQDLIVQMLARTWTIQSAEGIAIAFSKGQGPAKIYWDHFRKTLQMELWMSQSFQPLGLSGNEVIIKATPANVHLLVFKQGNSWRFGYMETFLERS